MATFLSAATRARMHRALDSIIDASKGRAKARDLGPAGGKSYMRDMTQLSNEIRAAYPNCLTDVRHNANEQSVVCKCLNAGQRDKVIERFEDEGTNRYATRPIGTSSIIFKFS